jgi:hypothetical protein
MIEDYSSRLFGLRPWLIAGAATLMSGSAFADKLGSGNEFLCYGLTASVCTIDGDGCETMEPWELNLPDFVQLDLRGRVIKSTDAALEQRETPITRMEREDGLILLQGLQNGRAFSWVITEETGEGTMMIASQDTGVTVFTVCTPT